MLDVALAVPADHSMWALFLQADPIVKGVMILLIVASVACWAVIFDKAVHLAVRTAIVSSRSQANGRGSASLANGSRPAA